MVDSAVVAVKPSSPSYTMNTMIGFLVGCILTIGFIVLKEFFDVSIRAEEDITRNCTYPILAAVPDLMASSKGGYGQEKRSGQRPGEQGRVAIVGKDVDFAASEAYKLLRTKLQVSFADDKGCRVLGVSSALSGEGKSLTAVNLAYNLSQLDKKVLLIDCDMRRPSLPIKLPIAKTPGLSNFLTGQGELANVFQYCGLKGEEDAFAVIAAGRNPPNPVELLSSERMSRLLKHLRKEYDYVILDLPPIGEVSDALAVAPQLDGVLLVARQDYCDRIAFTSAVRQFEFIGCRILGIVFNCATETSGAYGKYHKKYYKRYEDSYRSAAERTARRNTEPKESRDGTAV